MREREREREKDDFDACGRVVSVFDVWVDFNVWACCE